jgi:magnesium transporter
MNSDLMLSLAFAEAHTLDAVRLLERLPTDEVRTFLCQAPPALAGELLRLMDPVPGLSSLEGMGETDAASILSHVPLEIATVCLRQMKESRRQSILDTLPPDVAAPVGLLLRYPERSAGSLMDPHVCTVTEDMTIGETSERLRSGLTRVTHYIYVLSRTNVLVGLIDLRELLLADPEARVSAVMRTDWEGLSHTIGRRAILEHPGWREFETLPVVDESGVFLGALDYKTVRRLEEEAQRHNESFSRSTGGALGELYWVGLSGLLQGATAALTDELRTPNTTESEAG